MFSNKSRYWVGILYVENLMDDWELLCPDIVQVPFAYCVHDKDLDSKGEIRKPHVHFMLVFSNTTTEKHALDVLNLLSAPGSVCCSTVQPCISVRKSYDYLIHDTETCKKLGKHLYAAEDRVTGNSFDIGVFEQFSQLDKLMLLRDMSRFIIENDVYTLDDVYMFVERQDNIQYLQVLSSYSGFFDRLCRGVYLKAMSSVSGGVDLKLHTDYDNVCCKNCGSVNVRKRGLTRTGSQRYRCKDCGKSWSI